MPDLEYKSAEVVADVDRFFAERKEQMLERPDDGARYVPRGIAKAVDPTAEITLADARKLARSAGLEWDDAVFSSDGTPHVIPVWASDARVDRHGDIVEQSWLLDEYAMNPVVLPQHDWAALPLGSAIRSKVIDKDADGYSGKALHQLLLFPNIEGMMGMSVYRLMTLRVVQTVSVGFRPGEILRIKDPDERRELGLPEWGAVLRKNTLMETSVVSLPANVGARISRSFSDLRRAAGDGSLKFTDVQVLRELTRQHIASSVDESKRQSAWREADARLLQWWRALGFEQPLPDHREFDVPLFLEALEDGHRGVSRRAQEETAMDKELKALRDELKEVGVAVDSLKDELSEMRDMLTEVRDKLEGKLVEPENDEREFSELVTTTLKTTQSANKALDGLSG